MASMTMVQLDFRRPLSARTAQLASIALEESDEEAAALGIIVTLEPLSQARVQQLFSALLQQQMQCLWCKLSS